MTVESQNDVKTTDVCPFSNNFFEELTPLCRLKVKFFLNFNYIHL